MVVHFSSFASIHAYLFMSLFQLIDGHCKLLVRGHLHLFMHGCSFFILHLLLYILLFDYSPLFRQCCRLYMVTT